MRPFRGREVLIGSTQNDGGVEEASFRLRQAQDLHGSTRGGAGRRQSGGLPFEQMKEVLEAGTAAPEIECRDEIKQTLPCLRCTKFGGGKRA